MVVGSSQGLLYTPHLQINRQLQRRLELPVCQQDEVNIRNLCATEPDDVHQDLDDYFENQWCACPKHFFVFANEYEGFGSEFKIEFFFRIPNGSITLYIYRESSDPTLVLQIPCLFMYLFNPLQNQPLAEGCLIGATKTPVLSGADASPTSIVKHIWVFPKIGIPQNGWFIMENPIAMDDLGVPLFSETSIYNQTEPNCGALNFFWDIPGCRIWMASPPTSPLTYPPNQK